MYLHMNTRRAELLSFLNFGPNQLPIKKGKKGVEWKLLDKRFFFCSSAPLNIKLSTCIFFFNISSFIFNQGLQINKPRY